MITQDEDEALLLAARMRLGVPDDIELTAEERQVLLRLVKRIVEARGAELRDKLRP
jgi:hypothetical protein